MLKGMDWSSIYTFCPWLWRLAHMTIWELSGNLCLNPLTSGISIHTLLAESDAAMQTGGRFAGYFNPHSPRREWLFSVYVNYGCLGFQSTLSSQRVTLQSGRLCNIRLNFNPHSPRREWLCAWQHHLFVFWFQSTLSSQRVTVMYKVLMDKINISIHTLLAESDTKSENRYFTQPKFQSTLSSQRVTMVHGHYVVPPGDFNPHSPRREWQSAWSFPYRSGYFNPHSPRREWLTPFI